MQKCACVAMLAPLAHLSLVLIGFGDSEPSMITDLTALWIKAYLA